MNALLEDFVRESNLIEGIHRDPTGNELAACQAFLELPKLDVEILGRLQAVFAPGKPLRDREGMNVMVGAYVAPPGGPNIVRRLEILVGNANHDNRDPWHQHCRFEMLHPYMDGNGRTGRMLWAWQMQKLGQDPFALPFLQCWYYQTLENCR